MNVSFSVLDTNRALQRIITRIYPLNSAFQHRLLTAGTRRQQVRTNRTIQGPANSDLSTNYSIQGLVETHSRIHFGFAMIPMFLLRYARWSRFSFSILPVEKSRSTQIPKDKEHHAIQHLELRHPCSLVAGELTFHSIGITGGQCRLLTSSPSCEILTVLTAPTNCDLSTNSCQPVPVPPLNTALQCLFNLFHVSRKISACPKSTSPVLTGLQCSIPIFPGYSHLKASTSTFIIHGRRLLLTCHRPCYVLNVIYIPTAAFKRRQFLVFLLTTSFTVCGAICSMTGYKIWMSKAHLGHPLALAGLQFLHSRLTPGLIPIYEIKYPHALHHYKHAMSFNARFPN